MFLHRCSLFAEQELQQDKAFWYDRLSWAFGLNPHMPFFASECGGLRRLREECCSPARSLRRLQVSLLWLSFRNPISDISKEEYFTFHESYITHLLHLKGKPSLPVPFSTAILEHTLSTVHCFALTY